MKTIASFALALLLAIPTILHAQSAPPEKNANENALAEKTPAEKTFDAPNAQTISIKMISPLNQTTDLQIICILKHNPAGDQYLQAMHDINQKLHNLLSNLRDRNEFTGELAETLLLTPPPNSITPRQILLIGVGDEANLTSEKLELIGQIAARESARLAASHVSFAPTLRDQGSTKIDVATGDAAFITGWIQAYDTQSKLAAQGLTPPANVATLTIEAGPKYFDAVTNKVSDAIQSAATTLHTRSAAPYTSN
jgi:hypothetical protein